MQTDKLQALADVIENLKPLPKEDVAIAVKILAMIFGEDPITAGEGPSDMEMHGGNGHKSEAIVITTDAIDRFGPMKRKRGRPRREDVFDETKRPSANHYWVKTHTRIWNGIPREVRGHWIVSPAIKREANILAKHGKGGPR